jgi:exodeoxyribonuclease V alpha subunit
MADPPPGTAVRIEGVLDNIVFRNDENGYIVARLILKGSDQIVTITGKLPGVVVGENLRCAGTWVSHARFGRQLQLEGYEIVPPGTREGIVKYLSSGLVKGIGPKLAARMVSHFGKETLRIIDEEPERLKEIPGIGARRVSDIAKAWSVKKDVQEIMVFLRSYGVGQAMAVKIYSRYGKETVRLIKENAYRLCEEIFGIGFRTADRIAANLGVEPESPFRIRAVISHILDLAASEGHLCLPWNELVHRASEATKCAASEATKCAPELIEKQILSRCKNRVLVLEEHRGAPFMRDEGEDRRLVFLRALHDAEQGVHSRLKALKQGVKKNLGGDTSALLRQAEEESGLSLHDSQRDAIAAALREPVLIITGGPGVGKTTIIRFITSILDKKGFRIALAAPTGRAAKRLGEATGCRASTIHRLIRFNPRSGRFEHDLNNPLPCDMLILDECSMVDVPLADGLLKAVPDHGRVLFVGDADQLPSVGPGDFLRSLIDSGKFPVLRLTRLFRQKAGGGIVAAAHAVNRGEIPEFTAAGREGETFFVDQPDPEKAAELVVRLVSGRIPARFGFDPVRDIQVLTPMHKGPAGTEKLNAALRAALNPGPAGRGRFRVGDKVMQIRNNYDLNVFNGDMGRVEAVDPETGVLKVRVDDQLVEYEVERQDELLHAYCVSIHKSQGCEFPAVVIPLLTQHFLLLKRNLLYTGLTRARKLLVVVGALKALRIAAGNNTISERWSLLENRLKFDASL